MSNSLDTTIGDPGRVAEEAQDGDNQRQQQQQRQANAEDEAGSDNAREIHGLLVRYRDDEIDESLHSALQGKRRVHYKCMDVYSNFVVFGTSVGAIYLFRLTTITHAACKLALVIPCDQGSVEVIKFLPGSLQSNDLLVAIGTSRGSLIIFQLTCLDEQSVRWHELYRAEEFTKSLHESAVRIKLIEYDQDLADVYNSIGGGGGGQMINSSHTAPSLAFTKLYICDQNERIFVLESSSIQPAFRLLYSHKPAHVLSVDESTIHQICVHRSQLLMSTDEKTRIFREHTNELVTIGKRQRKTKGFFGACFFSPNYKPARMLLQQQQQQQQPAPMRSRGSRANMSASQQTIYSSTNSLVDMEDLLIYIARPKFSLWQVNNRREVMLTHIFDSSIRSTFASQPIELYNSPIEQLADDDYKSIERAFSKQHRCQQTNDDDDDDDHRLAPNNSEPISDHFEKLIPIFSTTLGNLLLSYTRHEIYVIDPIGARLIAWYKHDRPITQVCCNENEIFILAELNKRAFRMDRLILLAPTQFILELHRINRFLSLMVFVQAFCEQLRQLMALPLHGPGTITTEGGLLRNIVWNTWRECSDTLADRVVGTSSASSASSSSSSSTATLDGGLAADEGNAQNGATANDSDHRGPLVDLREFSLFRELVDEILDESRQLKQSIENLADSRLLFTVSNENIERLCSEPYASMVSLDINISNLHTNHVVHFSQEALQRHKSIAKLSQSIMNLSKLKRASTQANLVVADSERQVERLRNSIMDLHRETTIAKQETIDFNDKRVVVEQLPPKQRLSQVSSADLAGTRNVVSNAIQEAQENNHEPPADADEHQSISSEEANLEPKRVLTLKEELEEAQPVELAPQQQAEVLDRTRCPNCQWPRARAHLKPMHHSQQIQHNWIQTNLMDNFEENVDLIEERAFKHGLWHLILKCYAFRNQLDDYIMCCIMLDDVRLLNVDRFASPTTCDQDDLINSVFEQLKLKMDSVMIAESDVDGDGQPDQMNDCDKLHCFRCKRSLPNEDADERNDDRLVDSLNLHSEDEDDISFNLVNLFGKFMLRKDPDVKRAVSRLLQHPELLNRSKISANFYLQAIANQCATIRRTRPKVR